MTLIVGAVLFLGMWWLGRNASRLSPALTARLITRLSFYGGLALAALFLMRGRVDLALLFGAGAVWVMEGKAGIVARGRSLLRVGHGPARHRSACLDIAADASDGAARAGPLAGAKLSQMPLPALIDLLALCRASDPVGARLLEAHLDGRRPGWRINAQRDGDSRTGRPPNPGAMTEQQAHEILGLEGGATLEEIRAAHRSLMKRLHPDQGGVGEGAARVNAARDRLMNRHR